MSKKIIDFILWKEGFYPFSPKFDLENSIKKFEEELKLLEFDPTSKSVFEYSIYFNLYFQEIAKFLREALSKSLLDKPIFIKLLIADLNRTEILITEETKRAHLSGDSFDRNSLSNTYIKKSEFQNKSESSWALIDSAIDIAILNLNYLKYVKFRKNKEIENEIEQVDVIKHLTMVGSSYHCIKQAYDNIIWKGYTIENEGTTIKLKSDPYHLKLDNAALTRLTNNTMFTYDELVTSNEKHKDILKYYHETRKFQEIKSIEGSGDNLLIKYQDKKKKASDSYISFMASLLTYYPFYLTQKIETFENLTTLDLVNLFSILHDLVELLPMPDYEDTEVTDLTKFQRFTPKVKKTVLLNHFKKVTKYSENQVSCFLNLLIQKGDDHNLYRYPIYEDGEYLFFALSIFRRVNMLYLIDRWLDEGTDNLYKRGYKFEEYITEFLKNKALNKFAKFSIVEQSKFSFFDSENNRFEEEIDLVLITESTIIIAEVKCTTYPLETNNVYSSFGTIKKAKKQIVRKAQFLEDNWGHFESILGKKGERKIEKIIVVNFPHFAGRNIEGIPVTDFYLFLSYFKSGKFSIAKLERGKKPVINNIPYYDSVESFENNFGSFFLNPIPIRDLVDRQTIEQYEVTVKGTEPKIFAQRVIYKPMSEADFDNIPYRN